MSLDSPKIPIALEFLASNKLIYDMPLHAHELATISRSFEVVNRNDLWMWPRSQNEQVRSQITAYRDNERFKCVPRTFLLAEPFGLQKINTDPYILTHVNTVRLDDKYPKLKIYISELILGSIPSSHPVIQLACNLAFNVMWYQMLPLSHAHYMLHRSRSSWLHKDLSLGDEQSVARVPPRAKEFSILPNVRTESRTHPASYWTGTGILSRRKTAGAWSLPATSI
jgi:hypothetical protein